MLNGIFARRFSEADLEALEAIQRAGAKDRVKIRDAVFATRDYDGVLGKWSFDANGDTSLATMSGRQVKDGKFDDANAVVQGRNAIGIELPNAKRETVFLRELRGTLPPERITELVGCVRALPEQIGRVSYREVPGTTTEMPYALAVTPGCFAVVATPAPPAASTSSTAAALLFTAVAASAPVRRR